MDAYGRIHPERPIARAAAALAIALCVHAVVLALLFAWALAVAAAAKKAEAARPKEVELARLDAARWEENRRVVDRALSAPLQRPAEPARVAERSAVAMIAPGRAGEPRRPAGRDVEGASSVSPGSAAAPLPSPTLPSFGGDGERGAPGEALDLRPRPQATRPLAMRFDPVGAGQLPVDGGTSFGGLTVQTPEAWRFTNFFGRAVEAMNSVYRYELGAPMPFSLRDLILSRRAREACSFTSVQLDRGGRVVDASVRRSSGLPDVDQLIVEVIRRTAPFVNVPAGLTDDRGIYSDTWGLCIGIRG